MNKKYSIYTLLCLASITSFAQTKGLKQVNLAKWGIPGANYSGISHVGDNMYAVVNDKDEFDGFYIFNIDIDSLSGKIRKVSRGNIINDCKLDGSKARDAEGIAYIPSRKSVFISAESDQRIMEQTLEGRLTGKEIAIPTAMGTNAIYSNYGFEALTYSESTNLLWTTTENTLRADGKTCKAGDKDGCILRLQSFDAATLLPSSQYVYRTDAPKAKKSKRQYAFGVPALCALHDGSLLVMEREFYVAGKYIGSFVCNKIYRVYPKDARPVAFTTDTSSLTPADILQKELVCEFKTRLNLLKRNLTNYEGMCLGPRLADGRQTLLLISDSQNNYGNRIFKMKDCLKVIIMGSGLAPLP